jgi:hypothetical protein
MKFDILHEITLITFSLRVRILVSSDTHDEIAVSETPDLINLGIFLFGGLEYLDVGSKEL